MYQYFMYNPGMSLVILFLVYGHITAFYSVSLRTNYLKSTLHSLVIFQKILFPNFLLFTTIFFPIQTQKKGLSTLIIIRLQQKVINFCHQNGVRQACTSAQLTVQSDPSPFSWLTNLSFHHDFPKYDNGQLQKMGGLFHLRHSAVNC